MKRDVLSKRIVLSFSILLLVLFSISFILAQDNPGLDDNIGRGVNNIAVAINQFYSGFGIDPEVFTLIMFGILVWMVIYSVIKQMNLFQGDFVGLWVGIFSLIVTILAFIGFPREFINGILFQYSAMGATIVTIIPFLIMFYFTVFIVKSQLMARLVWLVYTVYFFSLAIFYIANNTTPDGSWITASNLPYFGAMFVGLIVLIYLGTIRALAFRENLKSKVEGADIKLSKRMSLEKQRTKEADMEFGGGI